jgi:hypothetical protein
MEDIMHKVIVYVNGMCDYTHSGVSKYDALRLGVMAMNVIPYGRWIKTGNNQRKHVRMSGCGIETRTVIVI